MRVRLLCDRVTASNGAIGEQRYGAIVDMSPAEAKRQFAAGLAEPYEEPPETATVQPAQNAMCKPGRPRKVATAAKG